MISDPLLRPHNSNITNFELTSGCRTSHECSKLYSVSEHSLYNMTGFAELEVILVINATPTLDVAPGEQLVPDQTVYDPTIEPGTGIIFETIQDIPGHLNSLALGLVMGLVHTLLLMVYYTIFKHLESIVSFYMEIPQIDGYVYVVCKILPCSSTNSIRIFMLEKAVSEHPYAIYPWLSLALLTLLEPFLTFVWDYLHQEFHDSHEAVMKRLGRCEAKAWGQTILIKALGEAKDRFNLALEALTASLEDAKTQISGIEERVLGIFGTVNQQDEDMKKIARSFENMVRDQHSLREHVGDLSTNLYREHAELGSCLNRFVQAYGSNGITLSHRFDCLEHKVDALEREKATQAAEIETLKSALSKADEERAAMITFYRKQKFNNLATNEYYQRAIAEAPEDQLAPAFTAYMTAMHSQMNATLQGVYRTAGGHPHTPQPHMPQARQQNNGYGMPENGSPGYGFPGLGSSRYGPAGGFPFNQRK